MSASFTPSVVRMLMPDGYLKILKEQHEKATGRSFSEAMVSYVVKNGRTMHPLWPLAVKLAKKEMSRLKREQAQTDEFMKIFNA